MKKLYQIRNVSNLLLNSDKKFIGRYRIFYKLGNIFQTQIKGASVRSELSLQELTEGRDTPSALLNIIYE